MPPDTPAQPPYPPNAEARLAVLEEIAAATKATLTDIRADMRAVNDRLARFEERFAGLESKVEHLSGRISQIPSFWQMLTLLAGFAAVIIAALRFG